jgi:HSP20 family protein
MNNVHYQRIPLETFLEDAARALSQQNAQPREHMSTRIWNPLVDVYEDGHAIVIHADLPGLNLEDINIELTNDTLTLKGERKFADEANREKYVRIERQYGAFQRTFTIGVPIQTDQVKATYSNGVLELTLPKAEAVRPKKVQVTVG